MNESTNQQTPSVESQEPPHFEPVKNWGKQSVWGDTRRICRGDGWVATYEKHPRGDQWILTSVTKEIRTLFGSPSAEPQSAHRDDQ